MSLLGDTGFEVSDLRDLLRRETAADHQILDDRFSALNLQHVDGYSSFLRSHHMALGYCYRAFATNGAKGDLLPPNPASELSNDILALGGNIPADWAPHQPLEGAPLGMAYVLAGSRLGARILLKRVLEEPSRIPAQATAYLESQQDPAPWKKIVTSLKALKADPDTANAIILSARQTFGVFNEALGELIDT